MERRDLTLEVKIETREDGKPVIRGRGAPYFRKDDPGSEYELWPGVVERIMPGAFDEAIGGDVRSFFNHDPNIVLGRTKSGTLRISTDKRGMNYETDPPETDLIRDQVLGPMSRGDVDGSSFMFTVPTGGERWTREERDGKEIDVREITRVKLFEVGPVTMPAYGSSSSGVRVAGDMAEVRSAWEQHTKQTAPNEAEAVAIAMRMAQVHELESKNY